MPTPAQPLLTTYLEWITATVDEDGFEIPQALALNAAGEMTVHALALTPDQAYRYIVSTWTKDELVELVFALDRFTKPGQGTTLGDCLAGFHLTRAEPRPFVIEYQFEPRIVKPIEWENPFWNAVLRRELLSTLRSMTGIGPLW